MKSNPTNTFKIKVKSDQPILVQGGSSHQWFVNETH